MSLLLLFPSQVGVSTAWSVVATTASVWSAATSPSTLWATAGAGSAVWSVGHYDFKNIWGEWETYTWLQVQDGGYTWKNLGGNMFATTGTASTVWTVTS